jgi:hypothetical protein
MGFCACEKFIFLNLDVVPIQNPQESSVTSQMTVF